MSLPISRATSALCKVVPPAVVKSSSVALSQSAVSQHLSKLRALRLVKARRDGKNVHYAIASDAVAAIMQTLYKVYCSETPSRASR